MDENFDMRNGGNKLKIKLPTDMKKTLLLLSLAAVTTVGSYQIGATKGRLDIETQLADKAKKSESLFNELNTNGFIKQVGYYFNYDNSDTFSRFDTKTLEKSLQTKTITKDNLAKNGVKVDDKYVMEFEKETFLERKFDSLKPFKKEFKNK